ncbi:RHS repeat-associated core domain-containing protein [Alkalimonas collagenimarina]|uniref:RHS repeat-associated core domain-containing protein n=1 Tax=Alkalimonas collagenimarina TaxID=400390 RepID=A0ABT9H2X5_9GAMM|nr:RHS repeat-associated core domain-containing protein [Alkalimonas collagenimarina]MDP4537656.1 RHS repeat-associated core domain-containing protein [Alkalimonas collagenimarina]
MSEKQLKLKGIHGSQIVVCMAPAPGIGKAIHFDSLAQAQSYLKQNFRLQAATSDSLLTLYSWLGGQQNSALSGISASRADAIRQTIAQALVDKKLHAYEVPNVTRPETSNSLAAGSGSSSSKKSSPASPGGKATSAEANMAINQSQSSNATGGPDLANKDKATCGDPVAMCNGEEILELTDFTLEGPLPLHWARCYRSSQSDQAVGLGHGWRTPFHQMIERRVNDDDSKSLVLINEEGRYIQFDDIAAGSSCHQLTEALTLHHDGKGSLVVYRSEQHWEFAPLQGQPDRWVLHKVLNSLGHSLQCFYDKQGRLSRIDYTSKKGIEFYYGNHHQIERIEAVEKTADGLKPLGVTLARYQYDEAGDLQSAVNSQQQQEHYRYEGHLLVERQRASGFRHYFSWDASGPSARCLRNWGDDGYYDYHFEYLDEQRLAISTDSRGQRWEYWHNAQNRLIKKVAPDGATWHYSWTIHGQKQSEVSPSGVQTEYRYNRQGQLAAICEADGAITRFEYNELGQRTTIVDAEDGIWQREFTAAGLLRLERRPDGTETSYRYNERDQLVEICQPDQSLQQFIWNDEGHLLATKTAGSVTRYSYDRLGRVNGSINAAGLVTEYIRDALGQLTAQKQYPQDAPDQAELQQYQYDAAGRLLKSTNAEGLSTAWSYEGLSQPVELRYADGSSLHYEYDKERNLTAIMRSDGARYQLDYDGHERPVRLQGFDGREQLYQYDADGKVSSQRDSNERFTKVKRDNRGRITEQTAQVQQRIDTNHFHYDKVGRMLRANNAQRKLRFRYDKAGQLTENWQGDWRLQHQYRHGRRSQTILPDGTRLDYHYHANGQLNQLAINQQPVLWRSFDAAGREVHREYASGLQQHQEFDVHSRLTEQRWQGNSTQAMMNHQRERQYQYSALHQVVAVKDNQEGDTRYQYNNIDQLIAKQHSQVSSHNETHQWDSFGNPAGDGIELHNDRLVRYHDHKYQYDACGNQTVLQHKQHSQSREFNGFNQLVSLNHDGELSRYEYDALGRRSAKITSQGRIDYLWDGDTLIGECQNGEFSWYLAEPGSHKPLFLLKGGELYSYQLDQLGTPLSVTDSDNKVVWQASYSVFGKATVTVNDIDNPIRFQGQYFDQESGLHYNHFRYYDPTTGRFISQDPIGLLGGINHYQYAPNHINWIDPLGLCAKENEHKYVLIGEGQAAVELYAELMREKYPTMEFRTIAKDWKSIVKKSGANREQLGSAEWERKAVAGNVEWIKDMHKDNYTFIDLGEDSSSNRSSFYLAEKDALKEINAKVLKANKKNIDIARTSAKPSGRPPSKIL